MGKTSIEWTDHSWPVVNGCRRVSAGCENCYAERLTATRLSKTPKYSGLAVFGKNGSRWTGETRLWEPHVDMPLRLKKPAKIFVADMGDLFYEGVPDEDIARIFLVMALAKQHTFQVLTKRPARMLAFMRNLNGERVQILKPDDPLGAWVATDPLARFPWPLPNVWLGVSVEDQATADERIPVLLQTPAAVRFVSAEPLLAPIDLDSFLYVPTRCCACGSTSSHYDTNPHGKPEIGTCLMGVPMTGEPGAVRCGSCGSLDVDQQRPLDWVIVGGESGPGARPFDVWWARSLVEQCKGAGVSCFVKQLGARPYSSPRDPQGGTGYDIKLASRKGGDIEEWPNDLRVREFPESRT